MAHANNPPAGQVGLEGAVIDKILIFVQCNLALDLDAIIRITLNNDLIALSALAVQIDNQVVFCNDRGRSR